MCHSCPSGEFGSSVPFGKISVRTRYILLRGVLRRFFLITFRANYVRENISRRKGACAHCGACCRLAMPRCYALSMQPNGSSRCSIYKSIRMPNCSKYPIDERDIAERDLIMPPEIPCGYHF